MSTLSTAILSLAAAAGLAGMLADAPGAFTGRQGPEFPLVALAWAQSKCGSELTAKSTTLRVHPEDFMRVAADYDSRVVHEGQSAACARAERVARNIAITP